MLSGRRPSPSHLGVFVEVHAGFRGDVLGADDLTVSLKALQLEELGCRKELRRRQGQNRGSVMPEARTGQDLESVGRFTPTSMTSVLRMCRDSVPPQYRYCMTSCKIKVLS